MLLDELVPYLKDKEVAWSAMRPGEWPRRAISMIEKAEGQEISVSSGVSQRYKRESGTSSTPASSHCQTTISKGPLDRPGGQTMTSSPQLFSA